MDRSASNTAARYERDGYVIPDVCLPPDQLAKMQRALEDMIEENPDRRPEHLVLRWGGGDNALPTHQKFLALAYSDCILDEVEKIIGPDIVCWGAHIFCKPGGTGLEVPWHQDGQFWPIRPLATCTVWITLDDSSEEN